MPVDRLSYPPNDDVGYLGHFAGKFDHVFVALNPFMRVSGFSKCGPENTAHTEVLRAATRLGSASAVPWSEVATLCDFRSSKQVNRALRLTYSKRIKPNYASATDTSRLLAICDQHDLWLPHEGYPTPPMTIQIFEFLKALGQTEVRLSGFLWISEERNSIASFLDGAIYQCDQQIVALDETLYMTMYGDFHYMLVCQTAASRRKANPADFFEGFDADETTTDYWGIGPSADL